MSIIINPGTGPVADANEPQARANMDAFCDELLKAGVVVAGIAPLHDDHDGDGRFAYRLDTADGRRLDILMPGIPTEQVRYTGADGQNIWDFPRLYVDGSSWVWMFAIKACAPPEGYVPPTQADLQHDDETGPTFLPLLSPTPEIREARIAYQAAYDAHWAAKTSEASARDLHDLYLAEKAAHEAYEAALAEHASSHDHPEQCSDPSCDC